MRFSFHSASVVLPMAFDDSFVVMFLVWLGWAGQLAFMALERDDESPP